MNEEKFQGLLNPLKRTVKFKGFQGDWTPYLQVRITFKPKFFLTLVDSQFPLSPIPRIQNEIENQPKLQKSCCNLNLISTYNAYIKTKQHSNTANAYYIPFINHIHLTTLPLDREWVPAVCRGSHFWSPAPRLNNTPMVVTTAQPDHDPHITHCQFFLHSNCIIQPFKSQ